MNKKAVVLFSGGIDSAVCLALAKQQGYACYCLSFDYGQRHRYELLMAERLAKHFAVEEHQIIPLAFANRELSSLTNTQLVVKENTYVPARNTIFLSLALGFAEGVEAQDLVIGANLEDYTNYPDCRASYFEAFEVLANLATQQGPYRIQAPLIELSKAEIIQLGQTLEVDFSLTSTCYDPSESGVACGLCESCEKRRAGFVKAGLNDPIRYQA